MLRPHRLCRIKKSCLTIKSGRSWVRTASASGREPLDSFCIEANSGKPDLGIGTKRNKLRIEGSCNLLKVWWPGTDLNRRRQPFQGCARPSANFEIPIVLDVEPRMVLLWYFRIPVFGSRPSEMRTSQVCAPRELSCPAFPDHKNTSYPETGTRVAHRCVADQIFIGVWRGCY